MFLHLLKIYLKNLYAPDLFFENFKKGFKSVVKNLFISLIVIYGVAVFTMMLIFMAHGAYNTLSIVERIEYFPAVSIIIAALTIFVFGITSVATSYYSGAGDEQFFAMPLSMKDIFCAKFALSFITDALLGLFVFVIFTGVYAAKEGLLTNPLFYLGVLVTFISFSVLLIALIYIIFIVFLLLFPKLRKKSFLTGLATVQVIVFAAVYSYAIGFGAGSSSVQVTNTSEAFLPLALTLASFAEKSPFLIFISGALKGHPLPIVLLCAASALVIFLIIPLMGKLYSKTLAGFSDVKSKKLSSEKASELISRDSKTNTAFQALLLRDVKTVLREPAFFANGPLFEFLFPLIIIVSLLVPVTLESELSIEQMITFVKTSYQSLSPEALEKAYYIGTLAISYLIFFTGINSNIASTAFSREGKSLSTLKAMPFTFETLLKAKFWHAMSYVFVGNAIYALLLVILNCILASILPWLLLIKLIILMLIFTSAISIPVIFADLLIDLANPKLNWENPAAAFKQNFNALFAMLFSMVMIAIGAGLAYLLPKNYMSLIYISALFAIIGAPLGSLYFRYGVKRLHVL